MTCVLVYRYLFNQTRTGLILQGIEKHKCLNVSKVQILCRGFVLKHLEMELYNVQRS